MDKLGDSLMKAGEDAGTDSWNDANMEHIAQETALIEAQVERRNESTPEQGEVGGWPSRQTGAASGHARGAPVLAGRPVGGYCTWRLGARSLAPIAASETKKGAATELGRRTVLIIAN